MQESAVTDVWGDWILERRDGGRPAARERLFDRLGSIREQVLRGAELRAGDTLVDVGCGDGLISLPALDAVGSEGHVVFVDISDRILGFCRDEVARRDALDRASFVLASADDLSPLDDESASAITTRAVLIYLRDKSLAFADFHRVLRPGGRISVWEPINAHGEPEPEPMLLGFDLSGVAPLAERVKQVYNRHQPPESDPMLDFDERDLLRWAEDAGLTDLELRLDVRDERPVPAKDWESFLDSAPNPLAPTWRQAVGEALSEQEAATFLDHLREVAEAGRGRYRRAVAHLTARKP